MSEPERLQRQPSLRSTVAVCAFTALLASCTATPKPAPVAKAPPQAANPAQIPSPTPSPTPGPSFPALVPLPASITIVDGEGLAVTPATAIFIPRADPRARFAGEFLAGLLTTVGPIGPSVSEGGSEVPQGSIVLTLGDLESSSNPEAYELSVTSAGVTLVAPTPAGLFYGVQTLRQILSPVLEHDAARPRKLVIPQVRIADHPRFAWRGAMLDVARHFFGVDDVKRYLDLLALHKMNRLHLHLSDDQGWRIEIKSWPNLTAMGGRTEVGGTVGGFYTQDQYKEIVAYASERFIEIVPEIDMPGHTNAALSAYPELNCDGVAPPPYTDIRVGFSSLCVADERTNVFIEDVIREIAALSPGGFFHVGGDEVKKLSPFDYAQFINRAQEIVERQGKRMIGWDEVATASLHAASVVQHWRPGTQLSGVAANGSKLIMSPANRTYLDMQYDPATFLGLFWAGRIEVRDAYLWDPATVMEGVSENAILGVEAPLWTETLANIREVESMAFPRLAALAEVSWSPQAARHWDDFKVRLAGQGPRWQAMGINFYRSPQVPWKP